MHEELTELRARSMCMTGDVKGNWSRWERGAGSWERLSSSQSRLRWPNQREMMPTRWIAGTPDGKSTAPPALGRCRNRTDKGKMAAGMLGLLLPHSLPDSSACSINQIPPTHPSGNFSERLQPMRYLAAPNPSAPAARTPLRSPTAAQRMHRSMYMNVHAPYTAPPLTSLPSSVRQPRFTWRNRLFLLKGRSCRAPFAQEKRLASSSQKKIAKISLYYQVHRRFLPFVDADRLRCGSTEMRIKSEHWFGLVRASTPCVLCISTTPFPQL